ncbi:MAG: hypothetical protein ACO3PV_06240, partial [Pseudohongiellaceae bacterium]
MDVLGRSAAFDVGKDSIVRVHIYHLRNKLNTYYAKHGLDEKWRIDIPKGQYMLATSSNVQEPAAQAANLSISGRPQQRRSLTPWLAAVAIALLGANLLQDAGEPDGPVAQAAANPYAATTLWQPILDDERPVLVLLGDYYIMGELDDSGLVTRMVREFDINSQQDLLQSQVAGRSAQYLNLDLSYTPTSVSTALLQVLKVFGTDSARVSVKLMSDFATEDLVGRHVIYIGLLSGLQSLQDILFSASGLATGVTFDELVTLDDGTRFTSSSGLSTGDDGYRDFGLLSTFPAPFGTQLLFIAGMRDEGLGNLAEEVTMLPALAELEQALAAKQTSGSAAFEALYEVLGFSKTNFDARLAYLAPLDTQVLWQNRLLGQP